MQIIEQLETCLSLSEALQKADPKAAPKYNKILGQP